MEESRRIKGTALVFLLLLLLLAGRLYYIQIICSGELTEAACQQQLIPVVQKEAEFQVYDRNMEQMVETKHVYYYLLHRNEITKECENLLALTGAQLAGEKGENYVVYRSETFSPLMNRLLKKNCHAYGFCVEVRDDTQKTADFLLDDLAEMYSAAEEEAGPSFYLVGDAAGGPLTGLGMRAEESEARGDAAALVTTLDVKLQENLEKLLRQKNLTGSVVVADTDTGQILAMASAEDAAEMEDGRNLAVERAYPIGCFYETIETVALAERRSLAETAQALGFGDPVFDGYPNEAAGNIDMGDEGIAATATPLQVCQMLTILAGSGNGCTLNLLMSAAPEDSLPCFQMTDKGAAVMSDLHQKLRKKPLTEDGWAAGYGGEDGNYAVAVHIKEGGAKLLYHEVVRNLPY